MPVENVTVHWAESLSPFVTVAKLRLPQQDIGGDDNVEIAANVLMPQSFAGQPPTGGRGRAGFSRRE
jgi:hypothetical protein